MTCTDNEHLVKYTGDSFRDLTRIARINEDMWAELFMSNKENILEELDFYIHSLEAYRSAIQDGDEQALIALLDEGRKRKEEVDG